MDYQKTQKFLNVNNFEINISRTTYVYIVPELQYLTNHDLKA